MSLKKRFLIGVLAVPLLLATPGFGEDLMEEMRKGWDLTQAQAAELERQLTTDPHDQRSRAQLLGYYFRRHRDQPARQAEHVLWFIRNAPDSEVLEWPEGHIMPVNNPEGYAAAKEAWLHQLELDPRNVTLVRNAAAFFTLTDSERSAGLLERAEGLSPSDPEWARELGHLHWREARRYPGGWDPGLAAQALADFERAYELTAESDRGALMPELGMAAFVTGDLEKARAYAEAMLESNPEGWNHGNRIHFGNLVLGRIALADGDAEKAGQYLLAAGRTPGSPQLNSFGPDMALAKDLLERGQTQTVVRYLRACLEFWEMGQDRLENWIALIEAGRTPDFRNLRF